MTTMQGADFDPQTSTIPPNISTTLHIISLFSILFSPSQTNLSLILRAVLRLLHLRRLFLLGKSRDDVVFALISIVKIVFEIRM